VPFKLLSEVSPLGLLTLCLCVVRSLTSERRFCLRSEAGPGQFHSGGAMTQHFSFLPNANTFTLLYFAVHYAPNTLSNLFDLATKVDGSMHLHFQVQLLLICGKSIPKQKALILGGDQHIICSTIFTTMFRDDDRTIIRKPSLLFRIATPGVTDSCLSRMVHLVADLCY